MGFVDEVTSGDRLRALIALREKLAKTADLTRDPKELTSLALRIQRVLEQIDELDDGAKPSEPEGGPDNVGARRAAKLRAATGGPTD